MNILIGFLTIVFSLYIYIVNRPGSRDAKKIFAMLIVAGATAPFGSFTFDTLIEAFLSIVSILSIAAMLLCFYGQICCDNAKKAAKRRQRNAVTDNRIYNKTMAKPAKRAA